MPYIDKKMRNVYDPYINAITDLWQPVVRLTDIAGEFTYVVYRLLKVFNGKFWMRALGIGCLVCAILEMYRREHSEYEDEKREQNGDV
jgi:hypothetical protein